MLKRNRIKPIKIPPPALYMLLILIGFAVGYTTNGFVVAPLQNPQTQQVFFQPAAYLKEGAASVCFTPNRKCQLQIIDVINKAKDSVFVQAYSFTDRDIAQALVEAAKRGVKVRLLLDKSNRSDKRSAKDIVIQNSLPLRFDSPLGIAHNKVMILDRSIILSGSYNFSAAAYKRNTENLLILHSPDLAKEYIQNWQKRWEVSKE